MSVCEYVLFYFVIDFILSTNIAVHGSNFRNSHIYFCVLSQGRRSFSVSMFVKASTEARAHAAV